MKGPFISSLVLLSAVPNDRQLWMPAKAAFRRTFCCITRACFPGLRKRYRGMRYRCGAYVRTRRLDIGSLFSAMRNSELEEMFKEAGSIAFSELSSLSKISQQSAQYFGTPPGGEPKRDCLHEIPNEYSGKDLQRKGENKLPTWRGRFRWGTAMQRPSPWGMSPSSTGLVLSFSLTAFPCLPLLLY
jgi:hypothetical protein